MSDELEHIEQEVNRGRNFDEPPLHLWDPALSGDIPIRITRDGEWYHDGGRIERESLVRLFASILRREEDGEYYLVTPVEKWRIEVDLHPLLVTDVEALPGAADTELQVTLNTGKQFVVTEENPLFLEPAVGNVAAMRLPHGLSALFSRPAWYRLVEQAQRDGDRVVVRSGSFSLALDQGD